MRCKGTISTLIWASTRVDIKELAEVRKQFRSKFGKQFETAALNNEGGILNERIVAKLSVQPPTALLVNTYLEKIADEFEVQWKPLNKLKADQLAAPMAAPSGYSVQVAPGSGLATAPSYPPPVEARPVDSGDNQSNDDSGDDGDISTHIPFAEVMTTASKKNSRRNEEPDIYIPPAPQNAKPDIFVPPPAPGAKTTGLDDYDDDDDKDNFDDLQARFKNLNR